MLNVCTVGISLDCWPPISLSSLSVYVHRLQPEGIAASLGGDRQPQQRLRRARHSACTSGYFDPLGPSDYQQPGNHTHRNILYKLQFYIRYVWLCWAPLGPPLGLGRVPLDTPRVWLLPQNLVQIGAPWTPFMTNFSKQAPLEGSEIFSIASGWSLAGQNCTSRVVSCGPPAFVFASCSKVELHLL